LEWAHHPRERPSAVIINIIEKGQKMKLVLLGTAGLIPTDQAQTACFMLPEVGILLDAGTGLYRMHHYLQTPELDIYLSHAHGDHTSGLIYLFASFFVAEINRSPAAVGETNIGGIHATANRRLHSARIHATQAAIDFLAKEYEPYRLDWNLVSPHEPLPGGGTLTAFNLDNRDETGFRLDWPGHSLAYVTDTTAKPGAQYIENICGVDVLLHDCNGPDRLETLNETVHHSTPARVARLAADAQVGRLILVHRNPIAAWAIDADLEPARAIFPSLEMGVDGMEIEF
jgi:ribonuclease Z